MASNTLIWLGSRMRGREPVAVFARSQEELVGFYKRTDSKELEKTIRHMITGRQSLGLSPYNRDTLDEGTKARIRRAGRVVYDEFMRKAGESYGRMADAYRMAAHTAEETFLEEGLRVQAASKAVEAYHNCGKYGAVVYTVEKFLLPESQRNSTGLLRAQTERLYSNAKQRIVGDAIKRDLGTVRR